MAAIDDLITQIEDPALRNRLKAEFDRLIKQKKFGLVFEDHLPELTPVHSATIRKGCLVALRDKALTDTWRVLSVSGGQARCMNQSSGERQELPVEDLLVVRQFGEPIFPSLIPLDWIENGALDAPWHNLIEADNYHALQLLEYLYAGQVDCIYIDPPYNTGARDWKYNNDYVDANDRWRHSKWLAMMKRRLGLAKRLLNPQTGMLIVTIDEHEVHHLRVLLEEIFPETYLQMVTAVINPKGVTQGRLSRVEEHLLFCFKHNATIKGSDDDLLNPKKNAARPRWKGLLRSGDEARRQDRPDMFYPILVDVEQGAIVGAGEPLPINEEPDLEAKCDGLTAVWPIRSDGSFGRWGIGPATANKLIKKGYVSLGRFDLNRKTYGITYLSQKLQNQVESGELQITNYDDQRNVVDVVYAESAERKIKTVWHRSTHDAGAYGADLVSSIIGRSRSFSFPKSLYAVKDTLACLVRDKKNAIVLDFFAGSGTTLHAVNLLNAADNGKRRCILVTNNEVSEEEAKALVAQGYRPGDPEWEQRGICRSVTWPRCKYTILGRRDDGTELEGEYLTGKTITKERPRRFQQIGFVDPAALNTVAKKKQLVALIEGIPQAEVKKDSAFVVSEKHPASILFNEAQADAWLDALEDQEHITDFYIVTSCNTIFEALKAHITELLGPITMTEEEKRPMREGFAANLAYFRLDFLDKDQVALGWQFRELLPILWLRAGAVSPWPELPEPGAVPDMLIPEHNPFAVLIDETRFAVFLDALVARNDITHVFLVTDSEEAFQEMAAQLNAPHVVQLYRDYLENFMINKGEGI